jgi:2-oxo-3-hexenedioate decarboxylase
MNEADLILDAFASYRLIAPLSDSDPSLDEDRAYAISHEIATRRIARGETPVGRKIGFTNRTIWPVYDVWAPIWGYVYDSTLHHARDGSARLAIGHLLQPRIEPEIQLHFAKTPPVTRDASEILACIDWIAHGFEIVQSPYADWKFRAVDTIAACGLHGALVVGEPVPVSGIRECVRRLSSFTVTLSNQDRESVSGGGADVLDSPLLAYAHLADVLAAQTRFPPVQAGEIVTTGTLTAAMPVAPGETWSTSLDGIDLPGLQIAFE